jgi:hypothetical protein
MRSVLIFSAILLLALTIAGCGYGKSSTGTVTTNVNQVTNVTVNPNSVSLNAGDVLQITALAVNSAGTPISSTFTYSSSNTKLATISPTGLVCGGVWDSAFVVCKGTDNQGNQLAGQTVISASAAGVTSSPIPVSVHPTITSITVGPATACTEAPNNPCCTSITQTQQFAAKAFHNSTDITALVGPMTWQSTNTPVATIDTNGVLTARTPGLTGVFATNTNVSSSAINFRACMPIEIRLHVPGDTPGNLTTSANITQGQTLTVEADFTDEKGFSQNSAPVTILSNNPVVATVSSSIISAPSFGGAGIIAVCTPPACGGGVNNPVYSNLFSVTVPGTSPATTVYATTTAAPPSGTTPSIIPIDTSKTPPAAGAAITLPGVPNSFVADAVGDIAYLGTDAGLVTLDMNGNTTTLVGANIKGVVLAVSRNGDSAIVANNQPPLGQQHVSIFNRPSSTFQDLFIDGAVSATYDTDGFKAYITANTGKVYVVSPANPPNLTPVTLPAIGTSSGSIASLASDPFVFFANNPDGLDVIATCNDQKQASAPPTITSTIQLVGAVPNSNLIVAVDNTGVDIETVTVNSILSANPAPFTFNGTTCAPPVSYSNQFVDFNVGPFTAHQLLVPSNGTSSTNGSHIVVLPAGIPKVLVAIPGATGASAAQLTGSGATEAFSGGLTPDGNILWVGVGGSNTVDEISLTSNKDMVQIAPAFKKADGTTATPDLVVVKPK